jgi:hemoglobin
VSSEPTEQTGTTQQTPYERFGGHEFFFALVRDFYLGVSDDAELRALYPEEDLGPAEERFRMFLEQYWGGPTNYSQERGHPRLRQRHGPFAIDEAQRDRWLLHIRAALDARELSPELDDEMWRYLVTAAHAMVNVYEDIRPAKPTFGA